VDWSFSLEGNGKGWGDSPQLFPATDPNGKCEKWYQAKRVCAARSTTEITVCTCEIEIFRYVSRSLSPPSLLQSS